MSGKRLSIAGSASLVVEQSSGAAGNRIINHDRNGSAGDARASAEPFTYATALARAARKSEPDDAGRREVYRVIKLRVREKESIHEAVRRFRKLCERSGLQKDVRRKAFYQKPSELRRREALRKQKAIRRATQEPM